MYKCHRYTSILGGTMLMFQIPAAQAPWLQSVAKSLLPGSDAYIPVNLGAKDFCQGRPKQNNPEIDYSIGLQMVAFEATSDSQDSETAVLLHATCLFLIYAYHTNKDI